MCAGLKRVLIGGLLLGFTGCESLSTQASEQLNSPSLDFKAYYGCMDREAEIAVKKAVGRHPANYLVNVRRIGDQVLAICMSRFSNGIPVQDSDQRSAELRATEALTALMNADMAKQQAPKREQDMHQAELDAPKLAAESDEASRHYGDCLFAHVKVLALNSTEPAEVVTRAAFASCQAERKLISEIHRRYRDVWFDDSVLDVADKRIADSLILEVIKTRASRQPPQPPTQPDKAI